MNEPKVTIADLHKRFGANSVLRGIGFEVPAGRKSVLVGPAASGKTVLLKCLAGIHAPDSGRIEIDGRPVARSGSRAHIDLMQSVGVLFQQGGLFDSLTVWENIGFKLIQGRGMDRGEVRERALKRLASVRLPARVADLYPSDLSGGMQKRVGIARALAGGPSLLLLDEPTAGLDPITTAAINRLIDENIAETGATVLSITSDMDSACGAYDRLYMMHQGALVWSGETAEIEESDNPYLDQLIHGRAEGPIKMRRHARV